MPCHQNYLGACDITNCVTPSMSSLIYRYGDSSLHVLEKMGHIKETTISLCFCVCIG
jgi:hypothetical protein